MKKHNKILLILIILIFTTSISYGAVVKEDRGTKTIVFIVDELSLESIDKIVENYYGLGFLNIKGRKPSKEESLYMSINTGRKASVDSSKFQGISVSLEDNSLQLNNYSEFAKDFLSRNDNLKVDYISDSIRTSFIGDDSAALLAADKDGIIKYGENKIVYEKKWLKEKTNEALVNSDLLVMSYKIENQGIRQQLLKELINDYRNSNIFVIPRQTSKSLGSFLNKNLTPIIYLKNGQTGILESDSTRRKGFITVEDINYEILSLYNKEGNNIGNNINFIEEENPLKLGRNIFDEIFNLLIIAIIFQTLVYINQAYISYDVLRNNNIKDVRYLNKLLLVNIIIGLILGIFNLQRHLLIYFVANFGLTYFVTDRVKEETDYVGIISMIIYIMLTIGIILKPEILYNFYLGFNNLFYGARYYGFNNGIMGVYIATSIITFYYLKNKINNKLGINLFMIGIFALNMLVLSAGNAANTGGFITAIGLFLTMIYLNFLEDKPNLSRILLLLLIGTLIFGINMYFDSKSLTKSHAINFLVRIKESGISELINMVKIKLTELIKYTILPPFSIVMLGQIFTIRKLTQYMDLELKRVSAIIFFISILAYLINDTGMIAFVFMNQFNLANILSKINKKELE